MRINKFLSASGVCSRREADRRIEQGRVRIDGRIATLGDEVTETSRVLCDGQPVTQEEEEILLLMNKPAGIVCTAEKREKNNVIDFLDYPKRIYPIGRLDKDSTGLLLLTNNGDLVNRIMRAGNYHEKEYVVTVNHNLTEEFIKAMRHGVYLEELDETTRPCKVKQTGAREFHIILTQGLNRQIRRMCMTLDYRVVKLERIRIMNLNLGNLQPGKYRSITPEERSELEHLLEGSLSVSRYKK